MEFQPCQQTARDQGRLSFFLRQAGTAAVDLLRIDGSWQVASPTTSKVKAATLSAARNITAGSRTRGQRFSHRQAHDCRNFFPRSTARALPAGLLAASPRHCAYSGQRGVVYTHFRHPSACPQHVTYLMTASCHISFNESLGISVSECLGMEMHPGARQSHHRISVGSMKES